MYVNALFLLFNLSECIPHKIHIYTHFPLFSRRLPSNKLLASFKLPEICNAHTQCSLVAHVMVDVEKKIKCYSAVELGYFSYFRHRAAFLIHDDDEVVIIYLNIFSHCPRFTHHHMHVYLCTQRAIYGFVVMYLQSW